MDAPQVLRPQDESAGSGLGHIAIQPRETEAPDDPSKSAPGSATPDDLHAALPRLSTAEVAVLSVLSASGAAFTVGGLRGHTGLTQAEVGAAIAGLQRKGLVCRLNTVVESYAPRFPGLRVEGD